jgi:hypothetical protein
MATIVLGHGNRTNDETTFVPAKTTLRFYSGFDVNLSMAVGLTAIANGTAAPPKEEIVGSSSDPFDPWDPSCRVANYELSAMEDLNVARMVAIAGPENFPGEKVGADRWKTVGLEAGIAVEVVGDENYSEVRDGIKLCGAPGYCEQAGEHFCEGLLHLVKDSLIMVVACRGYVEVEPAKRPIEEHYGKAADPLHEMVDDLDAWLKDFYKTADRDSVAAEAQVDGLPQGTVAMLALYPDFHGWQCARHLKRMAALGDLGSMVGHLTVNEDVVPTMLRWLKACPAYGNAFDAVIEADVSGFMSQVFDKVPYGVQINLCDALPRVNAAREARVNPASESEEFGFSSYSPSADEVKVATALNAANIKAAGSGDRLMVLAYPPIVMVGEGHPGLAVDYVTDQARGESGFVTITKDQKSKAFGRPITRLDVTGFEYWKDLVEARFGELHHIDPAKPDPLFKETEVKFG